MIELIEVRLGDLVSNVRTTASPQSLKPEDRFVLLEHVSSKTGVLTVSYVKDEEIRSSKSLFRSGDVLYGKLRPQLRKCVTVEFDGACSSDILVLRPAEPGVSNVIAAILRGEQFASQVNRFVTGANLPRVNARDLLEIKIAWPKDALAVSKLENATREILQLRALLAETQRNLSQLEERLVG